MTLKKWTDIRAKKLSPAELQQIDREVEKELLEPRDSRFTLER
jgi:hypothetical protein